MAGLYYVVTSYIFDYEPGLILAEPPLGGDDKLHFFEFKSIHLGIHTSDNYKQLSNISSVSILKTTMTKLLL